MVLIVQIRQSATNVKSYCCGQAQLDYGCSGLFRQKACIPICTIEMNEVIGKEYHATLCHFDSVY
jgi:hypothetical protein